MRKRTKGRSMNRDAVWDAMRYTGSFAAVMVIGSLLILWQGENPVTAMHYILQGAFGSIRNIGNTLRWITPCILWGLCCCPVWILCASAQAIACDRVSSCRRDGRDGVCPASCGDEAGFSCQ